MIKIFIIHYDKLVTRKNNALKQLNDRNLKAEFISNYGKDKLTLNDKTKFINLSDNKISCFLHHIECYKKIVEYDCDYALILEDDFMFLDKFYIKLKKYIHNLPNDWTFLYIGDGELIFPKNIFNKFKGLVNIFRKHDNSLKYTNCYLIKNTACKKIIKQFNNEKEQINIQIERYLNIFINKNKLKAFFGEPKLASSKLNLFNDFNILNETFNSIINNYINNYELFEETIVYDFNIGSGGIGDCIKFFMFIFELCMKNNIKLYYKKNNIEIEKYIKLKYDKLYIDADKIEQLNNVKIVSPIMYYHNYNYDYIINIKDVFYFTDEVKLNSKYLFPLNITNYISMHLRLGDKYLETDDKFVCCTGDSRIFSEENMYKFIEENYNKNIFFCCDNNNYKLKIKKKYNNIIITNCEIGHSSLSNTTKKQVLDGITEFYILSNSEIIYACSSSGYSIIASKFNNIPLINL